MQNIIAELLAIISFGQAKPSIYVDGLGSIKVIDKNDNSDLRDWVYITTGPNDDVNVLAGKIAQAERLLARGYTAQYVQGKIGW